MMLASLWELSEGDVGQSTALMAGVVVCLGGSAYVCSQHIPERWYPKIFDVCGSHAVMHVGVTIEYCCEFAFIALWNQ